MKNPLQMRGLAEWVSEYRLGVSSRNQRSHRSRRKVTAFLLVEAGGQQLDNRLHGNAIESNAAGSRNANRFNANALRGETHGNALGGADFTTSAGEVAKAVNAY